jgi:hypothetical protein
MDGMIPLSAAAMRLSIPPDRLRRMIFSRRVVGWQDPKTGHYHIELSSLERLAAELRQSSFVPMLRAGGGLR